MGADKDEEGGPSPRWREAFGWLCCLLAAVMPTAVLATIAQALDRATWPVFVPALFIGIFTVMVLVLRPWTMR